MVPAGRLAAMLAGVALVCFGLALGAQSQLEHFRGTDAGQNTVNLAGDPVAVTGLFVAAGALVLVLCVATPLPPPRLPRPVLPARPRPASLLDVLLLPLLAIQRRVRQALRVVSWRLRPALVAAIGASLAILLGAYLAIHFLGMAWPHVVGLDFGASAPAPYFLSIALVASNSRGIIPSALGSLMSVLAGSLLLIAWGLGILWRRPASGPPAQPDLPGARTSSLLTRHLAATALAAPFLAIAGCGAFAILFRLPPGAPSSPMLLVLPVAGLACWGILATCVIKAWHLARASRHPLRAPVALDAWQAMSRLETGMAAALAGVSLVAGLLPRVAIDGLEEAGAPFGIATVNIYLQLQACLAIVLLPLAVTRPAVRRALSAPLADEPPAPSWAPLATAVAVGAALLLAAVGTWLIDPPRAMWAWVLASLPLVVLAVLLRNAIVAAPPLATAAYALWSIGNTVYATYTPSTIGLPDFDTSPGILGLWRLCAAILAACAVAALARRHARLPRGRSVSLGTGLGIAIAVVGFVELPLTAGPDLANPGAIVVGSAVAASDASVQVFYHTVAALALGGACLLLARILRPEWFQRGHPPGGRAKPHGAQDVHDVHDARPIG